MKAIQCATLGEAWLAALRTVYESGREVAQETRETPHLWVDFRRADFQSDPLLARFASSGQVEEMRKVFFSNEPNRFGHNYSDCLQGPRGRSDLADVVELLREDPASKRALVALVGHGDGRVPCVNVVHFLLREEGLTATYFARGQDIFRKFYADGVCLYELAQQVACGLKVPLVAVCGLIGSAHVYLADLAEIRSVLAEADTLAPGGFCAEGRTR
jgi:thymidylate synthase